MNLDVSFDAQRACSIAPALRMLYSGDGMAVCVFFADEQIAAFAGDAKSEGTLLFIENSTDIKEAFRAYEKHKGYKPGIVAVQGLGFFALGKTKKEAEEARVLFLEAESYRSKASQLDTARGRLEGRIVLITGAAQGFGKGIAEFAAAEGAYVAVADLNLEGAAACVSALCQKANDPYKAIAVAADVSDAASAERMIQETVLAYGGLDVLISNAGVLVAGSLEDMTEENFDFVTGVNYKGYFLCAKYASVPMKIQHEYSPGYLTDIIEINSKSGLEGSNKNFAYAGSKFGGIGLTQSFALELVEHGIKVNAVCPGNLLDGPLWSDPERGLFRQYLDSGKVPGAKTIADVRRFYEDRVPLKRGCTVEDVARAILYIIEQKYETGQAVPVTGGQIMLR